MKSSNSRPDLLVREIIIDVVAFKQDKLINAILESFDNLVLKIEKFEKLFDKIKKEQGIKTDTIYFSEYKESISESKNNKTVKKTNTTNATTDETNNINTINTTKSTEKKENDEKKESNLKDKKIVKKTKKKKTD